MDVNMPVKSGIETTSAIKEMCGDCRVLPYIIGLTGDASGELDESCKEAGMNKVCMMILM